MKLDWFGIFKLAALILVGIFSVLACKARQRARQKAERKNLSRWLSQQREMLLQHARYYDR